MRIEEKEYTKSIDLSIWKKIFPFLAPRKNTLIMVVLMNLLCSVVDIIMPLFQRHAIDSFIEKNFISLWKSHGKYSNFCTVLIF